MGDLVEEVLGQLGRFTMSNGGELPAAEVPGIPPLVAEVVGIVAERVREALEEGDIQRQTGVEVGLRVLAVLERDADEPLGYSEGAQAWGYEGDG